jgi:HK97 family phage portal protein
VKLSTAIKAKILLPLVRKFLSFAPIDDNRGGWFRVLESFAGAWQQDIKIDANAVDSYWANFACLTLICSDIAKMPMAVRQYDAKTKIWRRTPLRQPLLKKPNHYQTTVEFLFSWVMSELRTGNTYVLKVRDPDTGFVTAMYVLDPNRVVPYITSDGGVYYMLQIDQLSLLKEASVLVPASEIIHDKMYPLYHPLIGLPPVYACGIVAMQGHAIIGTSTAYFGNRGMPAGILTAPGHIPDDTAQRLKDYFDTNFTGKNSGKVAVLGDNLKFEAMGSGKASDAQLIEQLKMTGEIVCACYHVPGYKIGVGAVPSVRFASELNQQYLDQCLQYIIEKMESRLDEGLELQDGQQLWLDTSVLLRMDPQTKATVLGQQVKDAIISTNEARREDDLEPVEGGDSPMIQQQNYSLSALALRDERNKPKNVPDGQLTVITDLLEAAASGTLPLDTVRAMIAAAFPSLTTQQLDDIMKPLEDFEPTVPEPAKPPAPDASANSDTGANNDTAQNNEDNAAKELSPAHMSMIQALLVSVADKKIPVDSAKEMLLSIPGMTEDKAEKIVSPLREEPTETPKEKDEELPITQQDIEEARSYAIQLPIEEPLEVIE